MSDENKKSTDVAEEIRNKIEQAGVVAWDAYREAVGGKAWNGDPLPTWLEMKADAKKQHLIAAWVEAACAVILWSDRTRVYVGMDPALSAAVKYFSHDPEGGFRVHDTAIAAELQADTDFHAAEDFEHLESIEEICWGVICQKVVETSCRELSPEESAQRDGIAFEVTHAMQDESPALVRAILRRQFVGAPPVPARPRVVCLCGSSRFVDVAAVKSWELQKQGIIALPMQLLPAWYNGVREHHQAEVENVSAVLDELHLRKIEMADEVLVVNVNGYFGARTRVEIEHARKLGKPVAFTDPICEHCNGSGIDNREREGDRLTGATCDCAAGKMLMEEHYAAHPEDR